MTEGEWKDSFQSFQGPSEEAENSRLVKPTEEQQAILDATGRVLLVNARAGTGKTATLRIIASAYQAL